MLQGLEKLLKVTEKKMKKTETEKPGAVEGFTLVSCCQNLDLYVAVDGGSWGSHRKKRKKN